MRAPETRRLTAKQEAVLTALATRPDYWPAFAADLADGAGLSVRGCQAVLYHLHDSGVLELDEGGYYLKEERGQS